LQTGFLKIIGFFLEGFCFYAFANLLWSVSRKVSSFSLL